MTTRDTSAKLDAIARQYREDMGFEWTLLKYKMRDVLAHARGEVMLDIGCGFGFLCRELATRARTVIGLDGSPAKLARARELNGAPNITYVEAMFEEWRSDQTFDTIVATNVLEHVEDPVAFLRDCRRRLNPGGRLIATVPNALGLHKRIGKHMGLIDDFYALTEADLGKGHRRVYDRERLERDVRAAGLAIAHSGGILLKPLSHKQMESWSEDVVDALYEVGKELPDYCSSLLIVAQKEGE